MPGQPHGWENYYREQPDTHRHISHEDAKRLHLLFKTERVDRLLDLGCGDGRHLKYFSQRGYHVYGFDISPSALHSAADWLMADGLCAELACGNMTDLPWSSGFFDAIVSVQVLNHGYRQEIQSAIHETFRILKTGGWFYLCLQTGPVPDPAENPSIQIIAPDTYITISKDEEIGVPHYCFTEGEIMKDLSPFNLETGPYLDKRGKTCLLLRKPHD